MAYKSTCNASDNCSNGTSDHSAGYRPGTHPRLAELSGAVATRVCAGDRFTLCKTAICTVRTASNA